MGILSFLSPHVISGSMTIRQSKQFFDIIFCWLELLLRWAHQTQKQQSSCQQGSSSTRSSTSTPRECSSLHVEQIRAPSSRIRNHERFSRCAAASWAFQPSGNTCRAYSVWRCVFRGERMSNVHRVIGWNCNLIRRVSIVGVTRPIARFSCQLQ